MKKIKACIINVTDSQMCKEKVEGILKFKSALDACTAVFIRNIDTGEIVFARSICYLAMPKQQGQLKADHKFTFDLDYDNALVITEQHTGKIDDAKVSHSFQVPRAQYPGQYDWYTHKQFVRPRDPFRYKGARTLRLSGSRPSLSNIPKCLEIPSD